MSDILDYASSSDSDVEPTIVSDTVRGPFLDDSDNESVHSPQEDPLKYVASFAPLKRYLSLHKEIFQCAQSYPPLSVERALDRFSLRYYFCKNFVALKIINLFFIKIFFCVIFLQILFLFCLHLYNF